MKKFIAIITVCLFTFICVCSFVGCSNDAKKSEQTPAIPAAQQNTEATTEPTYDFPQLDEDNLLDLYTLEVKSRYSDGFFLMKDEEEEFYASAENYYIRSGYIQIWDIGSLDDYYNPVLYLKEDKPILAYTDEYGNVQLKGIYAVGSAYYGRLHKPVDLPEDYKSISSDHNKEIVFTGSRVLVYRMRDIVASYDISENARYCGKSGSEGYIFRIGDEVYALRNEHFSAIENFLDFKLEKLAEGVKFVVLADCKLSSDPWSYWSQPIFQMEDGSLKAYVSWEGNEEDPADSGHLVDVHEGGGYSISE